MSKRAEARRRSTKSILATKALLQELLAHDGKESRAHVATALATQSTLAHFCDNERHIVSMSLNHFKSIAGTLPGGFDEIDHLRQLALGACRTETSPRSPSGKASPDSADRLRIENQRLIRELRIVREDLALLQRAYDERCRQARLYAEKATSSIAAQCHKDQMALDRSLSLCRRLEGDDKITPIA